MGAPIARMSKPMRSPPETVEGAQAARPTEPFGPDRAARAGPALVFGQVRHTRRAPILHRFGYPAFFLRLPVHRLANLRSPSWLFGLNRPAPLSFYDSDHGDGRTPAATWIARQLAQAGLVADGEIWLETFPRVFGYSFKPVSFWHCHNRAGLCIAVLAEVHNTFGERHAYLLHRQGQAIPAGAELSAPKNFHVSPFAEVSGSYRFRFHHRGARSVAAIELQDAHGQALLQTSLSGSALALDTRSALYALVRYPLFSLAVIARIHAQALQLWRRRLPFFRKPEPPTATLTRSPL